KFARFVLRRLSYGPAVPSSTDAHRRLSSIGESLQRVLFGDASEHLGDGNIIVVPPGKLRAVPWGLLPRLRSRAVSVVPSAASWLRARRAFTNDSDNATADAVVLVRGPGLGSGGAGLPPRAI